VWDYGEGMEMLRVFWDEAVALTPASAVKDERNMPLCRHGDLAALWREKGLQDVVEEALTIETRFGSFDDFWTPFLEKQGPAGAYASSLPPADRPPRRGGGRPMPGSPLTLTSSGVAFRPMSTAPSVILLIPVVLAAGLLRDS